MRALRNISFIILIALLLQACMMPFGMGGMHGSMDKNSGNFNLNLMAMDGDYSQSLYVLISESNGNSKYFIKTENIKTGEILNNYDAELNLYRIPFDDAVLNEILKTAISEHVPFTQLQGGEQYINYSLLEPGQFYTRVNIFAIDGEILNSPLSFSYRFEYNMKDNVPDSSFLGANYWLLGAAMVGMMVVIMTIGF